MTNVKSSFIGVLMNIVNAHNTTERITSTHALQEVLQNIAENAIADGDVDIELKYNSNYISGSADPNQPCITVRIKHAVLDRGNVVLIFISDSKEELTVSVNPVTGEYMCAGYNATLPTLCTTISNFLIHS